MRKWCLATVVPMILLSLYAAAQIPMPSPSNARPTGWQQVEGLGPHSKIRIKSDSKDAVCFVHFVEEQQLTCSLSESIGSPTLVFPRSEVKSIKLSHWLIGEVDDVMPGQFVYRR